jgi:hypothetical protein
MRPDPDGRAENDEAHRERRGSEHRSADADCLMSAWLPGCDFRQSAPADPLGGLGR